jgi:glycosyltransferase involved in cell wall biosynthesis
MRIGILTVQVPFVHGGAEAHGVSLKQAFIEQGYEAELITVPFSWYPPELFSDQILGCKLIDVEESCGTPIDMVVGLKFPAYLIAHPNKVLWILHQHRSAYDLWGKPYGDLHPHPHGKAAATLIRSTDHELFPTARKIFANSKNVANRLRDYCGVESVPLYHPPPNAAFYKWRANGKFLLLPGRINGLKRQHLVIEALALCRQDVKLVIMGQAESETYLQQLKRLAAKLPPGRLTWLGRVSDAVKLDLFGDCLGVIAPPIDEDYGYVTLEAMLSSKPVITCEDSGGTLEFIVPGQTGLSCAPDAQSMADAMDLLWEDPARAERWGRAGRAHYDDIGFSWRNVVASLVS